MRRCLFIGIFALLPAAIPAMAQSGPVELVEQIDADSYRHYLDDLLYTHNGDNRGFGAEHDLARANIRDTFTSFGLETYLHPFTYSGRTYYNVVGVHEGTLTPDVQYIIGAHYDSVDNPGADDNGSGTAGVMEIARIASQYDFESTIIFIAFDREEQGLIGSDAYSWEHRTDDIRGMISLDMIAYNSGTMTCNIYGSGASNFVKTALAGAIVQYSGGLTPIVGGAFDASDHAPFEWRGKPACLLIEEWGSNPCYHSACDSVDTSNYIDYDYAAMMLRGAIGWLAEQAGLPGSDTRCSNMKKFVVRCNNAGVIKAKVVMRTPENNGQTITFEIDGSQPFDAVIIDRRAKLAVCCYNGPHEVAVLDPPACVSPLTTTCP
ncbi:MAG: M28 family peptidase [Phycisphaerales bacterium]|nr:M28 family peptidase [Phycisphaerales bacterium]